MATPSFDPATHTQVAAAIGRANDGWPAGHEKARTTRLDGLRYRGVWLRSRYGKGHELATMMAALDYLHQAGAGVVYELVTDVFCDSKATACYTARANTRRQDVADPVAAWLAYAMLVVNSGHNGVTVEGDNGVEAIADPDWRDAYDDAPA